jgi:hypothetical protein
LIRRYVGIGPYLPVRQEQHGADIHVVSERLPAMPIQAVQVIPGDSDAFLLRQHSAAISELAIIVRPVVIVQ